MIKSDQQIVQDMIIKLGKKLECCQRLERARPDMCIDDCAGCPFCMTESEYKFIEAEVQRRIAKRSKKHANKKE